MDSKTPEIVPPIVRLETCDLLKPAAPLALLPLLAGHQYVLCGYKRDHPRRTSEPASSSRGRLKKLESCRWASHSDGTTNAAATAKTDLTCSIPFSPLQAGT